MASLRLLRRLGGLQLDVFEFRHVNAPLIQLVTTGRDQSGVKPRECATLRVTTSPVTVAAASTCSVTVSPSDCADASSTTGAGANSPVVASAVGAKSSTGAGETGAVVDAGPLPPPAPNGHEGLDALASS
jgi:hypothetical protein